MRSHPLGRFLSPRSIAIVGASQNINSVSGKPLPYLKKHGYTGKLFPINPRYQEVSGSHCYKCLSDVPDEIDLAIVVVAAKRVPEVLEECAKCHVSGAVIISSGFAEADEEGRKLQERVKELCQRTGLRATGPNSQGYFNLRGHVAATFSSALNADRCLDGDLGFVSQSGALGFSTFCLGQEARVGFSYVVTTGNEADLRWLDFVDYLISDAGTHTIGAYVEGIRSGSRLLQLADAALAAGKPLVVLKAGRTAVGQRAAASHTAAMANADNVFDAACRQCGIFRVRDVTGIFDLARVFSPQRRSAGNRLAILTTSGGGGVVAADEAIDLGLRVEPLADATRTAIERFIPAFGSAVNPVDVTAEVLRDPEAFREALSRVVDDPGIDLLLIVLTMVTGESAVERAKDIVEVYRVSCKPVAVSWSASEELAGPAMQLLRSANIPLFPTPARAVRSLRAITVYSQLLRNREAQPDSEVGNEPQSVPCELRSRLCAGQGLNEHDAKRLLAAYDVTVTRECLVHDANAASEAATEIGYPVALKVVSPDVLHKTEVGGVRLNLQSAAAVRAAVKEVKAEVKAHHPRAAITGFLVQEMVVDGLEMIIGTVIDPAFGPTMMLGTGGIFVQSIRDVSYRVAPLRRSQADDMIGELKGADLLAGARGQAPRDRQALIDALCRLSALAVDLGKNGLELEINPLVVLSAGKGVRVVDALVLPAAGHQPPTT